MNREERIRKLKQARKLIRDIQFSQSNSYNLYSCVYQTIVRLIDGLIKQ